MCWVKGGSRKNPGLDGFNQLCPRLEVVDGALCCISKTIGAKLPKANYRTTSGHSGKQRLAALEWGLSLSLQGYKVLLNPN